MGKPIVYLAGAIVGLVGYDAVDWREAAAEELRERGIETLSPMRAKSVLSGGDIISRDFRDYEHHGAFFTSRGIMARDSGDVIRCDALLVNLLGLKVPSIGTTMELAWAHLLRKPTIVAMELKGNPHDGHPMIAAAVDFRFESLHEAIDAAAVVLNR